MATETEKLRTTIVKKNTLQSISDCENKSLEFIISPQIIAIIHVKCYGNCIKYVLKNTQTR